MNRLALGSSGNCLNNCFQSYNEDIFCRGKVELLRNVLELGRSFSIAKRQQLINQSLQPMEEKSLMVSTHSRRSIKVNMSSGSSEKDEERREKERLRERAA